jgi:hypothetical protein
MQSFLSAHAARSRTMATNAELATTLGLSRAECVPNLTRRFAASLATDARVRDPLDGRRRSQRRAGGVSPLSSRAVAHHRTGGSSPPARPDAPFPPASGGRPRGLTSRTKWIGRRNRLLISSEAWLGRNPALYLGIEVCSTMGKPTAAGTLCRFPGSSRIYSEVL